MNFPERVQKALAFFGVKKEVEGKEGKNPFIISSADKEVIEKANTIIENFENLDNVGKELVAAYTKNNELLEKANSILGEKEKEINSLQDIVKSQSEQLQKAENLFKEEIEKLGLRLKNIEETPNPKKSIDSEVGFKERFPLQKGGQSLSLSDPKDRATLSNYLLNKVTSGAGEVYNQAILKVEAGAPLPPSVIDTLSQEGLNIVE